MILPMLLMLQDAPAPDPAEDVVVIARRLNGWRGKVRSTIGITSCKTVKSTGDVEIDKVGCRALSDCFGDAKPKMVAAAKAAGRDKAARAAALAPINQELGLCFKTRRDALVASLATRRAATRKGA